MTAHQSNQPWWTPRPLTEEEMKQEIYFSKIKGQPHEEFSPETITQTLKALNLGNKYERTADQQD